MDEEIKRNLQAKAMEVYSSAIQKFHPEFILLWVVDEHGNELEHEFIEVQEALALVHPTPETVSVKNPSVGKVTQ